MVGAACPASQPPLYVMHVAETLKGGIASYLQDLSAALHAQQPSLRQVICAPAEHLAELGQEGVAGRLSLGSAGRSLTALAVMAWRLAGIIRRERPDILHVHSTFAGVLVRVLRMLGLAGHAAVVYCPHGWAFDREGSASVRRAVVMVERLLAAQADVVVNISRHEQRIAVARGIRPPRMMVCENAIRLPEPVARPARVEGSPLRVLFVGRFDRQKGVDIAARIVSELQAVRAVEFMVVGAPVLGDAAGIDFPEGTRHLGWVPRQQLFAVFRDADLVLMPSRWEGFGLVATEAMSVGTPVLAARVGGLVDIIEDGVDGWLFDLARPEEAVALLGRMDRSRLQAAGAAAERKVRERFDSARLANEILALYRELPPHQRSAQ